MLSLFNTMELFIQNFDIELNDKLLKRCPLINI